MQTRQLELFIAVSETLNFTAAARRYYITQAAVSQQIKSLEDELGFSLFERNNRRVNLTVSGRAFLEDAKAIVQRTRDAVRRAKEAGADKEMALRVGFIKETLIKATRAVGEQILCPPRRKNRRNTLCISRFL
ncbi:MAG: LysR family transcriptional regulator [Oscillospiraceae bacterium]|nr:LysR family transcriptional regulator [Oscillospiraceae bacterium]